LVELARQPMNIDQSFWDGAELHRFGSVLVDPSRLPVKVGHTSSRITLVG
jgi:hypothetical protein